MATSRIISMPLNKGIDALLKLLQKAGYEAKPGKVPSLRGGDQNVFRMDTLGEGYSEAELCTVITGVKKHVSHKKAAAPKVSKAPRIYMLIDIQAKLQAGNCAGYAKWSSGFNLKRMDIQ